MDKQQETIKTWDKVAKLYQDNFMDLNYYDHTYDHLCSLLKPNASIFEIGCGPGNITKYLLNKSREYKIDGIDTSPQMIELAKANNPTASFSVMDGRYLDAISKHYNAVVCGFCVPYLSEDDCAKLFRDCKRILLPGGVLYLSFMEGAPSLSGYKTGSSGHKMYFYYHELNTIRTQLETNGFKEIQLYHIDYPKKDGIADIHTVLIAQRSV